MSDGPAQSGLLLYVDDDPDDARAFEEALADASTEVTLTTLSSGEAALDYVCQHGSYADVPSPDLVVLSWDLSDPSGEDVLADLKSTERISRLPVIVLAAGDSRSARRRAYELQANAYVPKPTDRAGFDDLFETLGEFWLQYAWLPTVDESDGIRR